MDIQLNTLTTALHTPATLLLGKEPLGLTPIQRKENYITYCDIA
jgi:hypothetical protein